MTSGEELRPEPGLAGSRIGVVVIGRNEGERLRGSLRAARISGVTVVYADSGSSDGSCELARAERAVVVPICEPPFTAARGRNEGMERLFELRPHLEYVQFVDGDTALEPGWMERAVAALDGDPGVSAVCGHLAERGAQTCTWRRLMQMEWQGPTGDIAACGGIAMYRRSSLDAVGRFRASLVGGEEPELCERLRAAGGRIVRIDVPMGVHDSGIDTFGAWWTRVVRVGVAFADVLADRDAKHQEPARRAVRSGLLWGLALPVTFVACGVAAALDLRIALVSVAIVVVYLVQTVRIARRAERRGLPRADAWLYAAFCVVGKAPLALGWARRRFGTPKTDAGAVRHPATVGNGAEAHS